MALTVKNVPPGVFIPALAQHFKRVWDEGKAELPDWQDTVKTAKFKEYSPQSEDWYFVRAAAIARKIYLRGGTGVGAFSKVFGGRYRRGAKTEHFARSSRGLIRHILKQLVELKIIDHKDDPAGPRYITREGRRALDTIAFQCAQAAKGAISDDEEDEEK